MKRIHRLVRRLAALALPAMLLVAGACNDKSEDKDSYSPSSSVAVTSFRLRPDTKVMSNLDSVFFSIDLTHGVIFNADSLPVGTDVTRLVPVIVYPNGITSASIQTIGGKYEGTTDYKNHPTDSIDFSGDVLLTLVAENSTTSATYRLKVNVHKTKPDSIVWDRLAVCDLPSRLPSPVDQKTVSRENKSYSVIRESDGTMTLAVSDDLFGREWTKSVLTPGFDIDLRTFTASDKEFYALSTTGELYSSADATNWQNTGASWTSIIGGYGDSVLGLRADTDGTILHTSWPAGSFAETEIEEGFPVDGFSNFTLFINRWALHPIGTLFGGRKAGGEMSAATWAFDGRTWACLSETGVPALTGATIVPYFGFLQTSTLWQQTEYSAWLLMGGRDDSGKVNPYTYISYDYGVNWHRGDISVQLPDYLIPLTDADQVVMSVPESASLSDAWTKVASRPLGPRRRIPHVIDGNTILWDCPYIYIFGGRLQNGDFYPMVRRGVLSRLTFAPII